MAPAEGRRREPWGLEADYELALQENRCQGRHLMHLRIKLAGRDGFYLTSIPVPLWWHGLLFFCQAAGSLLPGWWRGCGSEQVTVPAEESAWP